MTLLLCLGLGWLAPPPQFGVRRAPTVSRAAAVMTPNPDTMPSSATVLQALHQLQYGGYRNLPVVSDTDGRPLAIKKR